MSTPVIAGLAVGTAFIVLVSYSFAPEPAPALPSENPTLVLIQQGREYVGWPGSYGWSNGRTSMNGDVFVDLVPEAVIELENASTISFVTRDDYVTNQPDVLQVLAQGTGQDFTYSGFDGAVILEPVVDHRDPDPSKNVFLLDLDDGQYILNVHAGWSPEQNELTGGVDYFFKIRVVSNNTIHGYGTADPLIVLTDSKILSFDGSTIEYEKGLDRRYSELAWDGKYFYLATLQRPGEYQDEPVENELLVLDENFNEVGSHFMNAPIYDFAAQNGIVYVLTDIKLRLLDLSQDPSFQKTNRSISFEKHVHDILLMQDHAYLLDNIVVPLYIHLVDLPSLDVHTREFPGVNAHLVAQDVSEGSWYVLRSMSVMNGHFEDLLVFEADSSRIYDEPRRYNLVSIPWDSIGNENPEGVYQISRILVDGNTVYTLGYAYSFPEEARELKLGIYSLKEGARLASLALNETASIQYYPVAANIILADNKLYFGGGRGVYLVDVSDPSEPFVTDIIETGSPVRYIAVAN